jgi:hypothetical protein
MYSFLIRNGLAWHKNSCQCLPKLKHTLYSPQVHAENVTREPVQVTSYSRSSAVMSSYVLNHWLCYTWKCWKPFRRSDLDGDQLGRSSAASILTLHEPNPISSPRLHEEAMHEARVAPTRATSIIYYLHRKRSLLCPTKVSFLQKVIQDPAANRKSCFRAKFGVIHEACTCSCLT